jgi:hypothetical protein
VHALLADLGRVTSGLEGAADSLERYARELERAHEHHRGSEKKLAVIGAVVVVTAVAVTVTMGAAAVAVGTAEAMLAESALAGAGAAVVAASAAESSAAAALVSSAGLMTGLRVLGAFVLPRLAQVEIAGGLSAAQQEAATGQIAASRVLLDMQLGAVGAGVGAAGLRALSRAELDGAAAWLAPHAVVGGAVAGTSALGQWETTGSVDGFRVVRDGAFGTYFSAIGWTIARNGALASATQREIEIARRWDWANPSSLERHVSEHGGAMGVDDVEAYARAAHELWQRAESGELARGWSHKHGSIVVFDPETSVFASFWPNGTARTMFIPTAYDNVIRPEYARAYWLRNVDRFL